MQYTIALTSFAMMFLGVVLSNSFRCVARFSSFIHRNLVFILDEIIPGGLINENKSSKIVAEHLGVKLRGNETFTELLEIEKQVKEHKNENSRVSLSKRIKTVLASRCRLQ